MLHGDKDPFGYPLSTYLWVFGLATFGGAVKYLNHTERFRPLVLVRDLLTAGFAGLLTFWWCEWFNIAGPLSAVLIATSGLMGTRALRGFERMYEEKFGIKEEPEPKIEVEVKVSGPEVIVQPEVKGE